MKDNKDHDTKNRQQKKVDNTLILRNCKRFTMFTITM